MATVATLNAHQSLRAALLERFWQSTLDGFWYPSGGGNSLVRIGVTDRKYRIERRRDTDSSFTLLVEALVSDFDAGTFARWCESFDLTVH